MASTDLTREQAEATLAAIVDHFRSYTEPMVLPADGDAPALTLDAACPLPTLLENFDGAAWTIMWEEGPDEWAYRASMGGNSEEDRVLAADVGVTVVIEKPATVPAGVSLEPATSYSLGLYPA